MFLKISPDCVDTDQSVLMQENFVDDEGVVDAGTSRMNAFELITLSQGLNLAALFDRPQVCIFHIFGVLKERLSGYLDDS